MNKTIATIALSVAALALTGCGASAEAEPAPTVSAPAVAAETPEAVAPEPEPTEETSVEDELLEFGEKFTYDDGVELTVKAKGPGTASETSAGAESTGGAIYLFDVTLKNGGSGIFDPTMFSTQVVVDDLGADQVYDSAQGLGDSFTGKILPGKKQTVTLAYAIDASMAPEVLLMASPSWEHHEALYFGKLGK